MIAPVSGSRNVRNVGSIVINIIYSMFLFLIVKYGIYKESASFAISLG
jgi:Na+-translocating ferredoxin:NAD+ oxidoreductase RnfD subunit